MPTRKRTFSPDDPRPAACRRAKAAAGGFRELAKLLGVTATAVHQWQVVPVRRCRQVSELTGIPVEELEPTIFKPEPLRRTA
jgi:DNA-binding transcriptional regulator YdaS (Cro superfamily)